MIEFLVKCNAQLLSLPAGVVVALFAIAIGYALKSAQFFANNRIPVVVMTFTAVWFPLVQFSADQIAGVAKSGWHIPLNIMLGVVMGAGAWLFHAQILKRWLDPKLFNDDGTRRFLKSDFTNAGVPPALPDSTPPPDAGAQPKNP
jgi:hypothetical protein